MQAECIDYRRLPEQNALFLRYLYEYGDIQSFYPCVPHLDLDRLKKRVEQVRESQPLFPREELARLLMKFNQEIEAGEATFRNLRRLNSPSAVAVVTGHQLGLFGGPAFTVYKAMTTVSIAQMLQEEGYDAVPVFWLASDDSDFEEVRSSYFFDGSGGLLDVRYPGPQDSGRMVGTVSLDSIEECLGKLEEQGGPQGEFRIEALELLRRTYARNKTFRHALGCWLAHLFRNSGLLFFDGLLPGYKSALQSVFSVALEKRAAIIEALGERSNLLRDRGFDPQVWVEDSESFLFLMEGQRRSKLEHAANGYRKKKAKSVKFREDELIRTLGEKVEQLGPNVLLRPILQDHLFPTAVYVGGPSEVAYFAQINAISSFWDMEMAVFPRVSLTIVDRKAQRLLQNYGLKVLDILSASPEEVTRNVLEQTDASKILREFDELGDALGSKLASLRRHMAGVDPTVAQMLEGAQKKIFYQVEKVEKRFVGNHRHRAADFGRHLDYLYSRLRPMGKLQERVVNFNQFLSEEGPELLGRLQQTIKPFCPSHQLVYL